MEQNNWINEVLESTKGMRKVEPGPFLFEKITNRINSGKITVSQKSPAIKWAFAMAATVIITLNVLVITNQTKRNSVTMSDNELISDISSELGYNSNYNY